jgi:hypothetical protein
MPPGWWWWLLLPPGLCPDEDVVGWTLPLPVGGEGACAAVGAAATEGALVGLDSVGLGLAVYQDGMGALEGLGGVGVGRAVGHHDDVGTATDGLDVGFMVGLVATVGLRVGWSVGWLVGWLVGSIDGLCVG